MLEKSVCGNCCIALWEIPSAAQIVESLNDPSSVDHGLELLQMAELTLNI